MSINNIISNPVILQELANALPTPTPPTPQILPTIVASTGFVVLPAYSSGLIQITQVMPQTVAGRTILVNFTCCVPSTDGTLGASIQFGLNGAGIPAPNGVYFFNFTPATDSQANPACSFSVTVPSNASTLDIEIQSLTGTLTADNMYSLTVIQF